MPENFSYFKRLTIYFLLLLFPVVVVEYTYYNSRIQRFNLSVRKEQEKEVELNVRQLSDYFRFMESEILTISQQEHVTEIFSKNKKEQEISRKYMENYFSGMIKNSNFFDQVRIVCASGIEHVRVNNINGKPHVVDPKDFRDISSRYYFQKAKELGENEIYISRFDLDPEKNAITYPVKPILRIATPIIRDGKLYGVFVVNIKGHEFFENLRVIGSEYGWQTYFLNQSGNFLMGPDPLKEWLSFKDSINAPRFQDEFKNVNILANPNEKATFLTPYGLFTFHRIDKNNFALSQNGEKVMEENWYIVSLLPMQKLKELRSHVFEPKDLAMIITGFFLVLLLSIIITNNVKKRFDFENQLINSERNLKLANKTKDKFISILAHDLKNPIASITGFTEIMKTNYDSMSHQGREKVLSAMENATQVLIRLIDDVLTWAKSQSGSMVVDPEIIFLNKVIDDAIKFSGLQAAKKEIKLEQDCTEEVFAIADQKMVDTVLRNLISNAVKFSYRGKKVIVGIKHFRDEGKAVIFVEDFGLGIPSKDKKSLFSLDAVKTTPGTENESGTGMGLILCKDFIERNGGELWFKSQEGKGSTFYFSLPAYLEDDEE
ncbi:ATP-binding protein [Saccharicrinis sp. FJH62]|uniref:sensor histidine kinase n=1 Tax=Saccharicrinis sp. FJH62 TaxID=3344657 RepID=UPI0035D49BE5